jgi:hypothetical protein
MTLTIPDWLLYALGIVGGIGLLGLAALGVLFIAMFHNYRPWR